MPDDIGSPREFVVYSVGDEMDRVSCPGEVLGKPAVHLSLTVTPNHIMSDEGYLHGSKGAMPRKSYASLPLFLD